MLTRIEYYIIRSKPVQAIIRWLKGIVLPGFEGVSLYHSLNFFRKQIFSNRFTNRANAVSFSFLMALPSLLLFFFSLIPHLPLPEKQILKVIDDMLTLLSPEQKIHETVSTIISDFIRHEKTVLLSFSILLTMYFSSNGMMGLMDNFESQLPGFGTRGAIAQRGIAILLTLMLILVVLLTIVVMMLQSWIISYLGSEILQNIFVLKLFAYILLIAVCFITISFTYKYGTAYEDRWKLFSPGAVIATFLITTSTSILFYAVNNLVNYNKIYGSIGTLIIFLIWINFIAQILLIGFDLNASIIVHRAQQKNLLKTNETEQV